MRALTWKVCQIENFNLKYAFESIRIRILICLGAFAIDKILVNRNLEVVRSKYIIQPSNELRKLQNVWIEKFECKGYQFDLY